MNEKRVGVVFPGHGEQYIGMGKDLYDALRDVQESFEDASSSISINFVKLFFASSSEDILSIRKGFLAVYLFEVILYQQLQKAGFKPDFIAGHGIGEYAACYASGSLSFLDGMYFLNKYASLYDDFITQNTDYTALQLVRGFTKESLQAWLDKENTEKDKAYIASYNTEQAFYVSGSKKIIHRLQEYCKQEVIRKVKEIGASYEMHSPLVEPLVSPLALYYHKIKFLELKVPVITNVDGVYVTTPESLQSAMMRKIDNPVQWYEVMQGFAGCDIIISVGAGDQLISWFQEVYPEKEYKKVSTLEDIHQVIQMFNLSAPDRLVEEQKDLHDADLVNEQASDYDIEE